MYVLDTKEEPRSTNCGGPDEMFTVQLIAVTTVDVGRSLDNYLGYKRGAYTFTADDVGRGIEELSKPSGYRCWSFTSMPYANALCRSRWSRWGDKE